ncbi:hypothetical protein K523DRAFT_311938 [Schizophyllum commune Tattone D]|nr:hypothetical protein K525DRAFT_359911 [Schizophyllum commune Loenen D]KAI5826166.1 hypothetical protein K523DRAFT_311938 [Schizophyllum commune Tattone D]
MSNRFGAPASFAIATHRGAADPAHSVDEISPEVIENTARQIEAIQQHQQQQQQHLHAVPHHSHTPQVAPPPPHPHAIQDQVMHPPPQQQGPPPPEHHSGAPTSSSGRKPKAPSVRRACVACHAGKTRCSESLPCQSCLKRGLGATCAYPDPDNSQSPQDASSSASAAPPFQPPPMYTTLQSNTIQQPYYDYNGQYTGASTSTFRPNKRPRNLTEEEAAAITRNFSRGDFFVGNSAPVRIDPRLPVRLTLGEGDHVHFTVGEALV